MQNKRVAVPVLLFLWHWSALHAQEKPVPALSLTLRDAVRLALAPRGNLSLDLADQSVAAAQAKLQESQAARKPDVDFSFNAVNERLSLDAGGFHSIHIPGVTFPAAVGPFELLESRVRIRQSLLDPASVRREDAARAGIVAAQT